MMNLETISGGLLPVTLAFAEEAAVLDAAAPVKLWVHLLAAVIFSLVGVAVLALCFKLMNKFSPFSLKKEIEEDQNVALAIIMGAVIIGMSIIIAAAIMG